MQARIAGIEDAVVLLLRAFRIVAQFLQVVGGLRPSAAKIAALFRKCFRIPRDEPEGVILVQSPDQIEVTLQARFREHPPHVGRVSSTDLEHRTELFIEQELNRRLAAKYCVELERGSNSTGKHHFAYRGEQPAVGTVVIGQNLPGAVELLHHPEERIEPLRIHVRRGVPQLAVNLGERRAAQAALPPTEINQDEIGISAVGAQLRRQRPAHVGHRRKCRHNERDRRGDLPLRAVLAPRCLH